MPEPSKDPINSKDEKYGNGSNSVSTENTTPLTVATVADQQKERNRKLKAASKIQAPKQYIVRTMHSEKNNADGTTKEREW